MLKVEVFVWPIVNWVICKQRLLWNYRLSKLLFCFTKILYRLLLVVSSEPKEYLGHFSVQTQKTEKKKNYIK